MSLVYRPEIDGFRALAVTSVVLFHAGISGFKKGFLGVDIFFVISGFLITSLIIKAQSESRFSYSVFIERRIRRILPALLVVMLACVPFAWSMMLPDPLENFGQSLVATSLISNNILLWATTGYWDLAAEYKPLLHTWSLGVEEQFYLIYPLLLLWALRLSYNGRLAVLMIASIISYASMLYVEQADPAGAFYLLHTRAWQLLVGGIAALLAAKEGFVARPMLAWVGLAMVLIGLSPSLDAPTSIFVTMVTIGTGLFLLSARRSGVESWFFTRKPVIFFGLISYSFYLWHQPVLSFLRISASNRPEKFEIIFALILIFLLSVASWHFIEKPFRTKFSTKFVYTAVFSCLMLTSLVGLVFHYSGGFPQRLKGSNVADPAGATIAYNERVRRILPRTILDPKISQPNVLIAGNSFARDFANILIESGADKKLNLMYRDDFPSCYKEWNDDEIQLISEVDIVIYASGSLSCFPETSRYLEGLGKDGFFVGPKHFGRNLNPLIRMSANERSAARLAVPEEVRRENNKFRALLGKRHVDLLGVLSEDGGATTRVANMSGELLTTDQIHLSQAGAIFLADSIKYRYPEIFVSN